MIELKDRAKHRSFGKPNQVNTNQPASPRFMRGYVRALGPSLVTGASDYAAGKKQRRSRFDVFTGMAFSNVVMFSIIVTTAATLGKHGSNMTQSVAEAASALQPIAGKFASTPFALGFVGAGMLAILV